ncbi:MAG: tRNA 2-thiouridine(34) synthase MnmA [Candidatus Latescibacteria bacterium]|jgi:tRNA-specific 2-thiouridylase|nr:tRNA 2-thiouridine(34) synthase MnmA [Candidatus Latescibacterota bacterium]
MQNIVKQCVVVAMSGGVDSSLAAALLHEEGHRVIGVTMKLWDYENVGGNFNRDSACCNVETMADARHVCDSLGVPHYVVDLRGTFEKLVIDDFVGEYARGNTPNPCVRCNTHVKWKALFYKARQLGADMIATGHYARISRSETGGAQLMKSVDDHKDQSYALWGLTPETVECTLLPIGELTKDQTRQMASERELKSADTPESQDICFVVDDDYRRFLRERIGDDARSLPALQPGVVVDGDGSVIAEHQGTANYTIGQRKGLGVAVGRPQYVTAIDTPNGTVTIGDPGSLVADGLMAEDANWISGTPPTTDQEVVAKIRYNDAGQSAHVVVSGSEMKVDFVEPVRAVTPGQSVVLYDGDAVLGGGVIVSPA